MTRVDGNTLEDHRTRRGTAYDATGRFTVSRDGKTAELTATGIGADGKPFTTRSVYIRQ